MIRTVGTHLGKRVVFGYDRYVSSELAGYRDQLSRIGSQLLETVDPERLHYLTSAELTCRGMQGDTQTFGVLCCGTGMGMSIAANKFTGIYAARCTSVDDARCARSINNANVLCLAANLGYEANRAIIDAFAETPYTGRKLDELEYITSFEATPYAPHHAAAVGAPRPLTKQPSARRNLRKTA